MGRLISIIVPVYQSERYLPQCIESILAQTHTEFELLLIDDGSTDGSSGICEMYASKDERIRVFHQINSGVSAARNKGIDEARGEWIAFVDSDDYVSPDYLAELYNGVNGEDQVLVLQGFSTVFKGEIIFINDFGQNSVFSEDMELAFSQLRIYEKGYAVGKLYNVSVLKDNFIRFNPEIAYAEDMLFMLTYILYIDKIVTLSGSNYFYRTDASVLSQKYNSFESEYLTFSEFQRLNQLIAEKFKFEKTIESLHYAALQLMRAVYAMYIGDKYLLRNRLQILKEIKSKHGDFIKRNYCPQILKMKLFKKLFVINNRVFDIACSLQFCLK